MRIWNIDKESSWRTGSTLYALTKDSGELEWKFKTGTTSYIVIPTLFSSASPPAVLISGTLYVELENALVALDAKTGEVRFGE